MQQFDHSVLGSIWNAADRIVSKYMQDQNYIPLAERTDQLRAEYRKRQAFSARSTKQAYQYAIACRGSRLSGCLRKHWDGKREDVCAGCPEVQVRATQKDLTYVKESPDDGCLLVFKIFPDGTWECCYNGNTARVWCSLNARKDPLAGP